MFDTFVAWLDHAGYSGIFALMFLENLFPPLPSELIMPTAGFEAARGSKNLLLVILSGSAGSLLGAVFWYGVGKWVGNARLKSWSSRWGRWVLLRPHDIDSVNSWFDRHSGTAVLLGRIVPAVRTLISVPAGVFGMGFGRFLLYSAVGILLWTSLLAGAGYLLESQYGKVSHVVNWLSDGVIGLIVVAYVYKVITWRPDST